MFSNDLVISKLSQSGKLMHSLHTVHTLYILPRGTWHYIAESTLSHDENFGLEILTLSLLTKSVKIKELYKCLLNVICLNFHLWI